MVFNSLCFAPFLVLVLLTQSLLTTSRARKGALILCSYAFYAAWYPTAIVLLWASTLFDFYVARAIARAVSEGRRRVLLLGSIALNLGVLFSFKYLGFFVENLNWVAQKLGHSAVGDKPAWILPVGISFYTFMSLAYVTDVYRRKREPEQSLLDFALFLSFFPHLVAGPIVRAEDFLPQCKLPIRPTWRALWWGLLLMVFGLFQKVVMADAWFAPQADRVFGARAGAFSLFDAWLGTIAFSGQIFCDFAGYSTCALGAAACLGYRLPENFRSPYAAVGFSDFWRRWHLSLSAWLRDYVYISLGGNRGGTWFTLRNLMLTMLIGGLWHGAAWTFVIWGALHGTFLCLERGVRGLAQRWNVAESGSLRALGWLVTLLGVCWAWVFFRAPTLQSALALTRAMLGASGKWAPDLVGNVDAMFVLLAAVGLVAAHWWSRERAPKDLFETIPGWAVAGGILSMLIALATMAGEDRAFIYFQF